MDDDDRIDLSKMDPIFPDSSPPHLRARIKELESKLQASVKAHNEIFDALRESEEKLAQKSSRLDALQTAVRNYLSSSVHDSENDAAWHLLSGAHANSLLGVETQSSNSDLCCVKGCNELASWAKPPLCEHHTQLLS